LTWAFLFTNTRVGLRKFLLDFLKEIILLLSISLLLFFAPQGKGRQTQMPLGPAHIGTLLSLTMIR
jgi:hypothetical protein